jgi:hypothetical protein
MNNLEKKFKGYDFEINIPDKENFDPLNEAVDVTLITKNGERYSANFITTKYITYIFEKNKRTKECAGGTYFCMPDMIIVEKIDKKNVKITIDDLIKNLEIENYFKKID